MTQWTTPHSRRQSTDETGAYSCLEAGYWVLVLGDGRIVCGKDADVVRLPAGAADAVLSCLAHARREA